METDEEIKKYPKVKRVISFLIVGYVIGVSLTYVWIYYLSHRLPDPEVRSKWYISVFSFLFLFILSYSRSVRCTITLMIPILCSTKGRSLIIAFAFILAASGPTTNIVKNVDVLTKSMSCGQTQLKESLGRMLDVMKRPLVAIKEAIAVTMEEIRHVMKRVQVVLFRIKELVLVLLAGIRNAFAWLGSIVSVCNKEFGTPFDRCMRIADDAMNDCRAKLGVIKGLCKVTNLFKMLCYTVKFIDVICVLVEFFNDAIIETVLERLNQFMAEVKNMFEVSVTFDHDFCFSTVASRDFNEIGLEIWDDLHKKFNSFFVIFRWLNILGSFLFLIVVIKALYFRSKYLRCPSFNNKYLTKEFVEINEARRENYQELALPLTIQERQEFVWLNSCRLTRSELLKIARSMLFLTITCIQIFCICFTDYCLFWLLYKITYYGKEDPHVEVPPYVTVEVKGGGFVGDIFHGIVKAFEPLNDNYTINYSSCMPEPYQPNYKRYWELAGLCFTAWVLLLLQPYGLRLRHIVMRFYYPEVTRERASWLYSQILLKRTNFFKLARRKARSLIFKNEIEDNFSFLDWLRVKTERFKICRPILGRRKTEVCIICSKPLEQYKVACETLGCKAIYCKNCFRQSKNVCCVCKNPIDYGDFSDISEAKDSSDELEDVYVNEESAICSSKNV